MAHQVLLHGHEGSLTVVDTKETIADFLKVGVEFLSSIEAEMAPQLVGDEQIKCLVSSLDLVVIQIRGSCCSGVKGREENCRICRTASSWYFPSPVSAPIWASAGTLM